MLYVAIAALLLVALTTLIHYEALRLLDSWLPRLPGPAHPKVLLAIGGVFMAHVLEIAVYATGYLWVMALPGTGDLGAPEQPADDVSWLTCLYFSAITFSSVGYGDVVPHGPIRMLAATQPLHGLVLIGWSASFAYIAMERYWRHRRG
jgi:hypothetical protein